MTDIGTFPTIQRVLVSGENTRSFKCGETIKAGQVVGSAATGVTDTIHAMNVTAGETPLGVALYGGATGDWIAVAMNGCEVYVAVADDTTGVDFGNSVECNDNAVLGTVSEFAPRADLASTIIDGTNDTTIDGSTWVIGEAMEDIAGNASGKVKLNIRQVLFTDHAVV